MWRSTDFDPAQWATAALAMISTVCAGTLFIYLAVQSLPVLQVQGWSFITGRDWLVGEAYGALPMIYGSLMVTGLALILVLPFALGSAIFTAEFLSPRPRLIIKSAMELLAGVPGIVYGLLGVSLLAVLVRDTLGLIDGNIILTAGILLATMILPTIMTLAEDSMRAIPKEYRETSLSLGLTPLATAFRVVVPQALPGIVGAVLLGLGRAMGETIAVMLVIGSLDRIPQPWYDIFAPAQSIPSKLGREAAEALGTDIHWSALIGLSLILFLLVMGLSLIGNLFLRRVRL